jgi:large subunit ribosomal protein L24
MTTSTHPRKQRKMLYNAPLHKKRKWLASHLAENLLLKYDRRSIPVIKGDTVKADGKKLARPLHASTLLITKLNLTDKWRRRKLESGLSETAKKEIEKEAAEQLKDLERQKAEDERKKKEEEEKVKAAEEAPEEIKESEEGTEAPVEPTSPESEEKETAEEQPKVEKSEPAKKPVKKPAAKTTKKKKEGEL